MTECRRLQRRRLRCRCRHPPRRCRVPRAAARLQTHPPGRFDPPATHGYLDCTHTVQSLRNTPFVYSNTMKPTPVHSNNVEVQRPWRWQPCMAKSEIPSLEKKPHRKNPAEFMLAYVVIVITHVVRTETVSGQVRGGGMVQACRSRMTLESSSPRPGTCCSGARWRRSRRRAPGSTCRNWYRAPCSRVCPLFSYALRTLSPELFRVEYIRMHAPCAHSVYRRL
eukprot:COSAG05_NODE_4316_length_1569_cov_1.809524_2_plen_223_part_00